MRHDAFRSGQFSTHFVDEHFDPEHLFPDDPHFARDAAVAAVLFRAAQEPDALDGGQQGTDGRPQRSRWAERRRR